MSTWPPKGGLTTPFVTRKDATASTSASALVAASAASTFEAILLTSEYPKWNLSFCPVATIVSQPPEHADDKARLHIGTVVKFGFIAEQGKPPGDVECTITDISTPEHPSSYVPADVLSSDATYTSDLATVYRLSWKQTSSGLSSERFHEIIVRGEGQCEVRTWACYKGMFARAIKWGGWLPKIEAMMQGYVADIKKHAEEMAKSGAA